jgi:hypothetical protein
VGHAYNPSYSGGRDQEDCSSRPTQANSSRDPISKIYNIGKKKKPRGDRSMTLVTECLLSKCKTLSSNPSTIKKKKKNIS